MTFCQLLIAVHCYLKMLRIREGSESLFFENERLKVVDNGVTWLSCLYKTKNLFYTNFIFMCKNMDNNCASTYYQKKTEGLQTRLVKV